MLVLAADGAESNWPGRIGKLLLMLAGMVALLDLVGLERLSHWKRKANCRRAIACRHRNHLSRARPFLKTAQVMAEVAATQVWQAAAKQLHQQSTGIRKAGVTAVLRAQRRTLHTGPPTLDAVGCNHISDAQLREFVARVRDVLPSHTDAKTIFIDQSSIAVHLEPHAIQFMIDNTEREAAKSIGWFKDESDRGKPRRERIAVVLLLTFLPVATLTSLVPRDPGMSRAVLFFVTYLFCCMLALTVSAGLAVPTVIATVRLVIALLWFRLAWLAWQLLGKDRNGRPLRVIALAMFFLGSSLDLAISWNQ